MHIPFVDLKAEYERCRAGIDANLAAVLEAHRFIGGPMVEAFEAEMAAHQEAEAVVACGSGTMALALILQALGVGPGDEVITTPCTAIPTAEAITLAGAAVVFADITPGTVHLDPDRVAAAVTPHTKAILPVHLYGIPADLDGLAVVARAHGLFLVEDCAQAQGARWGNTRVGNVGDGAAFSFFPSKNLGAFGDGGAMILRDIEARTRARMLANHGRRDKYTHEREGVNSRLDALQAAVLRPKLAVLDERNALRRRVAAWYAEALAGVPGVSLPHVPAEAEAVWHLYPVRVQHRDRVAATLAERGVATGLHYPVALHLQPAYARLGWTRGAFPEAEAAFDETLSLPMYPTLTREHVAYVAAALREAVGAGALAR